MAILLRSNGDSEVVKPASGMAFTLEELQGYVGGYIEVLRMDRRLMVIDEEGKHKNKPINAHASVMMRPHLLLGDYIVGDVLICIEGEME